MTLHRPILPIVCTMAFVLGTGCKPKAPPVSPATPAPASIDGTPATEAECKEFAAKVELAAKKKNRAALEQLISMDDLALRCISDLSLTGSQRQSLVSGMRAGLRKNALVGQILTSVDQGGSCKLLRIHEVDGRPRALFRVIGNETGVSYFDFVLTKSSAGFVSVEDIYLFAAGEMITQSIRRVLLPAVAELNKGSISKLLGPDRLFLDNMAKFQVMANLIRGGNKVEAIKVYKSLPKEFREQKNLVLIYVNAASGDDAEYTVALELFRKLFPNDAAVEFHSIDYFLLKKQYDESLRCIDKTDVAVGGDPYLNVLRSNLLVEAKRLKEARAAAEKAVEQEPTLADGYWSRLSISLEEKNHADTLVWLKKLVENTQEDLADLSAVEEYAQFVKSPQYAEWLKWKEEKKK